MLLYCCMIKYTGILWFHGSLIKNMEVKIDWNSMWLHETIECCFILSLLDPFHHHFFCIVYFLSLPFHIVSSDDSDSIYFIVDTYVKSNYGYIYINKMKIVFVIQVVLSANTGQSRPIRTFFSHWPTLIRPIMGWRILVNVIPRLWLGLKH
jgi:hypothetical protein